MSRRIETLPPALEAIDDIVRIVGERRPVFFLDYDGTLTPIVERPEDAHLDPRVRDVLADLARRHPTAVVSGRDLDDLRGRVGLETLYYAGSHGFRLAGPGGWRAEHPRAPEFRTALDRAGGRLEALLAGVPGAQVERKRYAISVHVRRVPEGEAPRVRSAVKEVEVSEPKLRLTEGRKILELRPDVDWDKGRALRFLLERLELDMVRACPIYVGDDLTDEDAFAAVGEQGVGIVVHGREGTTRAAWALENPDAVARFLRVLDAGLSR